MVPALIVQPFIENTIWHGILPKVNESTVAVQISKIDHTIYCTIDDDGVGREVSMKNKFNNAQSTHQSKGVSLTQTRLELSNVLNQRNATVEIIDKTNATGKAAGTKIILVFSEE
jgi:LytS/YehU family sensor histidine kinase